MLPSPARQVALHQLAKDLPQQNVNFLNALRVAGKYVQQ